eukprot:TRINITY_DN5749_c0_g1_i2.p1 TRINITY_DN5749_c0_g1~~TRINITY_DN5749_c0_g1_i2.p1  ORF type:complete len:450 (-),score=118.02 TRINITY_DN5749_c0_g1_i2:1213-2562(-)
MGNIEKKKLGHLKPFSVGSVRIPNEMKSRIQNILKGYNPTKLYQDSMKLSTILRARTTLTAERRITTARGSENIGKEEVPDPAKLEIRKAGIKNVVKSLPPIPYDESQTFAYLAHRVPGVYACNYRILEEISRRFQNFNPTSFLDFGSGPGTTIWAASQLWSSIDNYLAIEPSPAMTGLSEKMLEGFPVERKQYIALKPNVRYDIAMASYAMTELSSDIQRQEIAEELWRAIKPGGFMCIVEPGTPIGFMIIRNIRKNLLELEDPALRIIAPCPHQKACSIKNPQKKWCNFGQRMERIPPQQQVKHDGNKEKSLRSWENESYSYLLVGKSIDPNDEHPYFAPDLENHWGRVTSPPIKSGGHIILEACTAKGSIERFTVTKKYGKDYYRSAIKARWGDGYDFEKLRDKMVVHKEQRKVEREERDQSRVEKRKARKEAAIKKRLDRGDPIY